MQYTLYLGIDNGVSGSIGVLGFVDGENRMVDFLKIPTFSEFSYTKKRKNITRIHVPRLRNLLYTKMRYLVTPVLKKGLPDNVTVKVLIERPMVNPGRFTSTMSAIRALEATLIALPPNATIKYCDSREWQKVLLPEGSTGKRLKKDSLAVGCRLFPVFKEALIKHKDADGMLIAEYLRREQRG